MRGINTLKKDKCCIFFTAAVVNPMCWVQYQTKLLNQQDKHQNNKKCVSSCCNVHLFFRSLFCVDFNLSISIQRLNSFSPGVPRKNSLNSSKPGLLPWQQIPWQQISRTFSWFVPLLPTSQFFLSSSVLSSTPVPLSSSWTFSFLPSNLSLHPSAECRQTLHSQDLTVPVQSVWSPNLLKHSEVFAWLWPSITVSALLSACLTTVAAKCSSCSSEDS